MRSGPGASAPERGFALHTVKRNENLKKIARRYYPGDLEGWKTIFEANRQALSSADLVAEGTVLKIPLSRFGSPADRR